MDKLFLKVSIIFLVTAICGVIGYIEGIISGATGAVLLSNPIQNVAALSAAGIGTLGLVEGFILGILAVKGFFGTYETMREKGFKTVKDKINGYVGYTINQIIGGLTASLFLINVGPTISLNQIVSSVALGAAMTGVIITPIVTIFTAKMLHVAYHSMKNQPI